MPSPRARWKKWIEEREISLEAEMTKGPGFAPASADLDEEGRVLPISVSIARAVGMGHITRPHQVLPLPYAPSALN